MSENGPQNWRSYQQNEGTVPEWNPKIPPEYQPISMWGYFGYQILFAIPIVGLIIAIIWSFSNGNINRRNLARAQFCWLIIIGICAVMYLTINGTAILLGANR